jgi:hypothetical protein
LLSGVRVRYLPRLNGLWSPFEGRKYSVSRIEKEAAA